MTFGGELGSPLGGVESLEHFVCVAHWRDVVIPDLVTQQVSGEFGGGWTWRKNNFFKLFFFFLNHPLQPHSQANSKPRSPLRCSALGPTCLVC